jgi:hypothetical protein
MHTDNPHRMFSHVVIFWTDPAQPNAADELIAGANQYLKPIPGVIQFHVGKMVGSHRPVVDQTYQVALNLIFPSKQAQDDYQVHPLHIEFVEKVFQTRLQKGARLRLRVNSVAPPRDQRDASHPLHLRDASARPALATAWRAHRFCADDGLSARRPPQSGQ